MSWVCILDCRLALTARGSTISQVFLRPQATFIRALLLTRLGRLLIDLYSCASVRSMSSLYQIPAATKGVPM